MLIRSLQNPQAGRARRRAAVAGLTGAVAVAGALLAGAGEARAQDVPNGVRRPFAVKLGGYTPSSVDARRASGDLLFSAEVEYTIQTLFNRDRTSYTTIGVGIIDREDLNIVPITLNQIFTPGDSDFFGKKYYFGGGIGLYSIDMDSADTSGERKTLFGVNAVAGLDLGKNYLVELKYHYPFDYDTKFVGGLQLMAGIRF